MEDSYSCEILFVFSCEILLKIILKNTLKGESMGKYILGLDAETLQLNLRTKHDVFETKTLSVDAKNLRLIHKVTANTHL